MMNKLNNTALEEFSKSFAKKTTTLFFAKQEMIAGKEILSFAEVKQVNLFILSHLFAKWQEEIANLQSPYFDYHVPVVKEALQQFMNTVSQHIAVRKEHFEPLVKEAATSTLQLLLTPYHFFYELLTENKLSALSLAKVKEKLKYIQINKPFFQALLNALESHNMADLQTEAALAILDTVYKGQQDNLEDPSSYIALFSQQVPLSIRDLWVEEDKPEEEVSVPFKVDIEQFASAASKPAVPLVTAIPEKSSDKPKNQNLNERFSKEQSRLNDLLNKEPKVTLLDKQQKTRIDNIRTSISLNQKFLFINGLFRGDSNVFHQALNDLEECTDYNAAIQLLQTKYAKQYGWAMESEEVKVFFDIIGRKFY